MTAQKPTEPQQAATTASTVPPMPKGYGEPTFATPERSEPARGGGVLVARVTLPVPAVGLVIDAGVWRNPAKGSEPEYVSVSLPRYVRALEPLDGSRDNDTTGDVKDAILARWLEWRTKAATGTTGHVKPATRGRLVMPTT